MTTNTPLIVPIDVSAMVLYDNVTVARAAMNYGAVAYCQSPAPGPFANDDDEFGTEPRNYGVYLLWTLPKALRRRPADADDFPFVPNRWLVVRLLQPEDGSSGPPQATSWLVQSDGIDRVNGTAAYVDPTVAAELTPTKIGLRHALGPNDAWQEPSDAPPYFLRAVAEANPAFAAYQPFNENVFSIFDDLHDQNVGTATLSYYVVGWYSDPTADILAAVTDADDFATTVAELGWGADTSAGQWTTTTLYQGAAFAVQWTPGAPGPPPSPKDGVTPQVAAGATSMDAVVAFARAAFTSAADQLPDGLTPDDAAELITAFQYSLLPMLNEPGAEDMIEEQVRSHWYSSSAAGSTWVIVDAQQDPNAPPPETSTADDPAWLADLSSAQSSYDAIARQLAGKQRQLFELWWKEQAATVYNNLTGDYPWNVSSDQFDPAIDALTQQAANLQAQLNDLAGKIPMATATTSLPDAIAAFATAKGLPSTQTLKQVPAPRFWAPVDPVVVVSNTAHMLNYDQQGTLSCRWPDALVEAIEVATGDGAATATITAAAVASSVPAMPSTGLPAEAPDLVAELYLLDPANVAALAKSAGVGISDVAAAAASLSPPNVLAGAGTAPGILAPYPWQQPWRPLYLDWSIQWFPVPFQQPDQSPNWSFDGLDYRLQPATALTPTAQTIQGRSVLTPKPSFELKARIDQFIQEYPQDNPVTQELQALESIIGTADSWDFLSQSLSGLGDQLAQWNPVPTLNPPATELPGGGSLASLIGNAATMPPNPQLADAQRGEPVPTSTFEGMRGGQFYIDRLTIVDAFGQTLEIVEFTQDQLVPWWGALLPSPDKGPFLPLIGDGLAATVAGDGSAPSNPLFPDDQNPGRFVQLTPRVLQPARLNLDFVGDATGNPIVGWVLPNHLDHSLAAYGPDGTAYGALRVGVNATGDDTVAWDAAPGSPLTTLPTPSPQLGPLEAMLAELYALGPGALSDLLGAVDETLWTIDPLGARTDTFLTVLIGRPLAVVTATLSLELQADPWRTTDWPYTFADPPPDPLFLGYRFDVRLGDLGYHQDGLIGYYLDGDYTRFNAIYVPNGAADGSSPSSDYLQQIEPGNYVRIGFAASGPGTPAQLTLVMDPRAGIHARCALVPVKSATLLSDWVEPALAAMSPTFRTGPALVAQQTLPSTDGSGQTTALLLPRFAEQRGMLTWLEADGNGGWSELPLATVDDAATLAPTPPTLREGLLRLTGGVDA